MSHIGIVNKLDLLTAWMYLDEYPWMQERVHLLGGRTPEDVRRDVESFIQEKKDKYAVLSEMGMNLVFDITTHETQLVSRMQKPTPIGFASTSYYKLDQVVNPEVFYGADIISP